MIMTYEEKQLQIRSKDKQGVAAEAIEQIKGELTMGFNATLPTSSPQAFHQPLPSSAWASEDASSGAAITASSLLAKAAASFGSAGASAEGAAADNPKGLPVTEDRAFSSGEQ